MSILKVISRKSPLALLQVKEFFGFFPELKYELIVLESYGDTHKEISLLENPPTDLFTRELDLAILDGSSGSFCQGFTLSAFFRVGSNSFVRSFRSNRFVGEQE